MNVPTFTKIAVAFIVFVSPISAMATYHADVMVIAANTGAQLGKATYCGFSTLEFSERAGRAIDHYSSGPQRGMLFVGVTQARERAVTAHDREISQAREWIHKIQKIMNFQVIFN